jgi:DNA-binding transcriptional LysR family regulator
MSMTRDPFVLAFVPGVTPAKWIGVWKERMRDVPIELRPLTQQEAEEAVADGTAHVALLRLPFAAPQTSVIPLYFEKPVVVAPKGHAIEAVDSVLLSELSGDVLIEGSDASAVELVAANVGIALMPQSVARALSRKDVIARFVSDAHETQIALAWRTERTGPLIEEFVGIVRGRTANSSRGASAAPTVTPVATRKPRTTKKVVPKRQRRR